MGRSGLPDSTYFVTKRLGRAAFDGGMLQDGQRVAVALSGGAMSAGLLHALVVRNRRLPIRNQFLPVYVPDGAHGEDARVVDGLKALCRGLGLDLYVPSVFSEVSHHFLPIPHFDVLRQTCADLSASALALGHTAEDLALALLVSMGVFGKVSRLSPVEELEFQEQHLRVIRPMWLLTQAQVQRMVADEGLFSMPLERPRPHATYRCACMAFLKAKKMDLVEQLRNITLSSENVSWDYLV